MLPEELRRAASHGPMQSSTVLSAVTNDEALTITSTSTAVRSTTTKHNMPAPRALSATPVVTVTATATQFQDGWLGSANNSAFNEAYSLVDGSSAMHHETAYQSFLRMLPGLAVCVACFVLSLSIGYSVFLFYRRKYRRRWTEEPVAIASQEFKPEFRASTISIHSVNDNVPTTLPQEPVSSNQTTSSHVDHKSSEQFFLPRYSNTKTLLVFIMPPPLLLRSLTIRTASEGVHSPVPSYYPRSPPSYVPN